MLRRAYTYGLAYRRGAVLIRLIVVFQGKNAKNIGVWKVRLCPLGTAEDIKPFTDPVFENNIPLTQTERLTMNSRPKQQIRPE